MNADAFKSKANKNINHQQTVDVGFRDSISVKAFHMDYKPRMLLIPESGLSPSAAAFIYRYLHVEVIQR